MKHNFFMGQVLRWHVKEPWAEEWIRCVVTEVDEEHAIARTEGNLHPGNNDVDLWIDEDNEMDFFEEDSFRIQMAGV